MKRREFLKNSFSAAAPILLWRQFQPAAVSAKSKKVLIVGAGLSGLVAAYELDKSGHDVVILEPQNRIGGRVLTLRKPFGENLYADAGATRIPAEHETTLKYIKEFDLPLIQFYPNTGKFVRLKNGKAQAVKWEKFAEATEPVMQLGKPELWQKISGGTDKLTDSFARRLKGKIKLNAPVVRVVQDENSVKAIFNENGRSETIAADFLIFTVPFTMLRKIEISPAFSAQKHEAIHKLKYDSAARFFIETRRRFWHEAGLNGFAFGAENAEIWNSTLHQTGTHGILQTYLRGEFSEKMTVLDEKARVAKTLADLEKIFPETRENFVAGLSKCWSEDQFVEGAWAHFGSTKDLETAKKSENRIFFAGEHISNFGSWMQGALQSGLRTVGEIEKINV